MQHRGEVIVWKHNGLTGNLSAWDPKHADDGSPVSGVPSLRGKWSASAARKGLI